jgi:hypothetical protein
MPYHVELVGGPADGEVRQIETDRRELKFILPLNLSPTAVTEADMGPPATAAMEVVEAVYLRTRKINALGYRIYQYQK